MNKFKFFCSLKDTALFGKTLINQSRHKFQSKDIALYFLMSFFTISYLPQAFLILGDTALITALEVDPGSMLNALHKLYEGPNFYSMHNGFHSHFYGWTYFSLNFWLFMPVKIFVETFMGGSPEIFHLCIRLLLFVIGFLSVWVFYRLVERLFKSSVLALLGGLFLSFSLVSSIYYYFIHPETLGVLLILLSVHCLLNFIEQPNKHKHWYILGLSCLILASLSKQIFFFISLPILCSYMAYYLKHKKVSLFTFSKEKEFRSIFFFTSGLSLLWLILIHPYSLIQFGTFIDSQLSTLNSHIVANQTLSVEEAFLVWLENIYKNVPLYSYFILIIIPATIIAWRRPKSNHHLLFVICGLTLLFLTFIVVITARLFPGLVTYLYPLYPFLILYLLGIVNFIKNFTNKYIRNITYIIIIYLSLIAFLLPLPKVIDEITARLNYKDTTTYRTYNYLNNHLPANSKIAHDHIIALPKTDKNFQGCHYWQQCSTKTGIDEFDPDYIIMDINYLHNNVIPVNSQNLFDYIESHNMSKFHVIKGRTVWSPKTTIVIFKKEK